MRWILLSLSSLSCWDGCNGSLGDSSHAHRYDGAHACMAAPGLQTLSVMLDLMFWAVWIIVAKLMMNDDRESP